MTSKPFPIGIDHLAAAQLLALVEAIAKRARDRGYLLARAEGDVGNAGYLAAVDHQERAHSLLYLMAVGAAAPAQIAEAIAIGDSHRATVHAEFFGPAK